MLTDVGVFGGIDPAEFRRVLGHYPAGIAGITSVDEHGEPVGMTVSSFTSVSLDPPLVAFFPAKSSTTWLAIERTAAFCVNVLASNQEQVCRQLTARGGDKFAGIEWSPSPTGCPIVAGAVAWIDCTIERVYDGGDHWIVLGRVSDMAVDNPSVPLLFFQGGYGHFATRAVSAISSPDLAEHFRLADELRPGMQSASMQLGVEVVAVALLEDEMVAIATTGHPDPDRLPTRVGQRMPFVPPLGAVFAAWSDPDSWAERSPLDEERRAFVRSLAHRVRERQWSVSMQSETLDELERALARWSVEAPTPEQEKQVLRAINSLQEEYEPGNLTDGVDYPVRTVTVPVFNQDGAVRVVLTAYGLPDSSTVQDLELYRARLASIAGSVNSDQRT